MRSPSGSVAVEHARLPGAVTAEGALGTGRVRPGEHPVLPGGQTAEDLGLGCFLAGEPQVRLHPGERVRAERGALLAGDADLVVPVQLVRGERDQAEVKGLRRL